MNFTLRWQDAWWLDIQSLDEDHQQMVELVNQLAGCKDAAETREAMDALIAHVRSHFRREEDFLAEIGYPHSARHKREHAMQLAEFVLLRRDLDANPELMVDRATLEGIKGWFLNHVIAEDKVYAAFYHQSLKQAVEAPA
jgi:hemerythrin